MSREKRRDSNMHQLFKLRRRDRKWMLEAQRQLEANKPANSNSSTEPSPMKPGQEYDVR